MGGEQSLLCLKNQIRIFIQGYINIFHNYGSTIRLPAVLSALYKKLIIFPNDSKLMILSAQKCDTAMVTNKVTQVTCWSTKYCNHHERLAFVVWFYGLNDG